jgi:glycosyltransferase involved in cell wall biosynthesis
MPPRVTYWTGTWDPAKEGISKEIVALRTGSRATAPVVGFSPAHRFRYFHRHRALTLPVGAWPLLRGVAAVFEPRGDVTHVFGGQSSWHLVRALGRRPIVLTAVVPRLGNARLPHVDLATVVVETERDIEEWTDAGVPRNKIELIRPGINLDYFRPLPASPGPFTLLFASTPSDPGEIESRGIPSLFNLARLRPDIALLMPWRSWGDVAECRRRIEALNPPSNVRVVYGDHPDMREVFGQVHATVIGFAEGAGKSCPNFVVEGLACGRPAIVPWGMAIGSPDDGVCEVDISDAAATSDAVSAVQSDWSDFSARARAGAERLYDAESFIRRYEELYDRIAHRERQSSGM